MLVPLIYRQTSHRKAKTRAGVRLGFSRRDGNGMIGLLCFVLAVLGSPFKSKLRLEAENAVLRHQLNVLRRRLQHRID